MTGTVRQCPGDDCRWKAKSAISSEYDYCPLCGSELDV